MIVEPSGLEHCTLSKVRSCNLMERICDTERIVKEFWTQSANMSRILKHIIFENQPCKSCNSNIHRHFATLSIKYLRNWPHVRNQKGNWLLLIISGYDIGKWFQANQAIVTPTPVCTRPLPQHTHTHTHAHTHARTHAHTHTYTTSMQCMHTAAEKVDLWTSSSECLQNWWWRPWRQWTWWTEPESSSHLCPPSASSAAKGGREGKDEWRMG